MMITSKNSGPANTFQSFLKMYSNSNYEQRKNLLLTATIKQLFILGTDIIQIQSYEDKDNDGGVDQNTRNPSSFSFATYLLLMIFREKQMQMKIIDE